MNFLKILLIVWFSITAILVAWYFLFYKRKGSMTTYDERKEQTKKAKRKRFMEYVQSFYKKTPWIKSLYSKTFNRFSTLYPSDISEIHKLTTLTISKTLLIAFAITAFGVLTSNGSLIYIMAHIFISYISMSLYIDNYLESMGRKLLKGFFGIIPRIGKEYEKRKILDVAIYNVYLGITNETSFTKRGGLAGLFSRKKVLKSSNNAIVGYHLQRIHKVLTATHSKFDLEVQMYLTSAPNQFLTMFLSICKNIKTNGDEGLRTGEGSIFKKRLYELQEWISDEINNTDKLYYGLRSTPYIALFGLLLIQPFRLFSQFVLPDMASFFETSFWNIMVCAVFATSIFVHKWIMTIKNPFTDKQVTESIWYRILQGEPIIAPPRIFKTLRENYIDKKKRQKNNNFINRKLTEYQQKYYSRCMRIERKLKRSGENMSVKMYLLKKCTLFLAGFVFSLIILISGVIKDKILAVPSFTQSFEESLAPSDSYKLLMSEVAEDIANQSGRKVKEAKTLTEMVVEDGRITRLDMAQEVANEIVNQNTAYGKIYFKAYYLLIALAIALLMFFAPDFFLRLRSKMTEVIKEDEVNQFRTIISLEMENASTTARTILYDMQKFAQYYKEPISRCIIDMDVNQKKALNELKKADNADSTFADIVDGLINISVGGVAKSFESIKAEKGFYRENRKLQIDRINTSKIDMAQRLCFIPAYVTVFMTLFIPLGIKAFAMFNQIGLK